MEPGAGQIHQQPVVEVEVSSLLVADSPRILGENPDHVATLASTETKLPPIIVHRPTMRVIDGMHRLRAARLRGQRTIPVRFFDGPEADAFVLAVEMNIAHGLPLSIQDRKRAAERIVITHPQWSDRMIASVSGISAGTVNEVRRRVRGEPVQSDRRIGQDGRIRPMDGTEGRRVASELISANPGLSLRQIARAAGISPETARDVRNRMGRGEDPLPNRRRKRLVGHGKASPDRQAALVGNIVTLRAAVAGRAAAVERLRADPALRFSETGRGLLRLLNLHTIKAESWEKIVDSVPPHCSDIVAQLARECAETWMEVATRIESQIVNTP